MKKQTVTKVLKVGGFLVGAVGLILSSVTDTREKEQMINDAVDARFKELNSSEDDEE